MRRWSFLLVLGVVFATPRNSAAAPLRRVAILVQQAEGIDGSDAEFFRTKLNGGLLKSRKFAVVDRARLDAILREQGFSNSSYADPATAVKLGKLLGAAEILHVSLSIEQSVEQGGFVSSVSVDVTASFDLIDVESGSIVRSSSASGSASDQISRGSSRSIQSGKLRRAAIADCVDDLAGQVSA